MTTNRLQWKNKMAFWNIHNWQLLVTAGLFVASGLVYWLTLMINTGFTWNPWSQTLINFTLKGLWSLPFYWLTFIWLSSKPLQHRLLLHLLWAPLYVACWLFSYHAVADFFGIGYMWGYPMVWDVFIPLLLYVIQFSIIHAYEYYHHLQNEKERAQQLKELAYQSDINALKAQIQPHFLFNTLNSISASVPSENEATRMLIAQLADTFRFALRTSQKEWVPLTDELNFIANYLQLEQRRFTDRLLVNITVAPEAHLYQMPSMLLQPIVENAIVHGVSPSIAQVALTVAVVVNDSALQITISDTGSGLPANVEPTALFSKGVGLGNTQQRLQKQFGTSLLIEPNQPSGLSVTITLPLTQLRHASPLQSTHNRR